MSDNLYNINVNKLGVLTLPTSLRKSKMIAWLKVLLSPFQKILYDFKQKRAYDLYRLNHTGQVFSLRKLLNDQFDYENRRIQIIDAPELDPQYIYTDAENKPVYLDNPMYLYENSNYTDAGIDFVVLIPMDVWQQEKTEIEIGVYRFYRIESLIDFFRLASKRYMIQIL